MRRLADPPGTRAAAPDGTRAGGQGPASGSPTWGLLIRMVLVARAIADPVARLRTPILVRSPAVSTGFSRSILRSRLPRPPPERSDELAAPAGPHQKSTPAPVPARARRRTPPARTRRRRGAWARLTPTRATRPWRARRPAAEDAALGGSSRRSGCRGEPEPPGEDVGGSQEHARLHRDRGMC